VVMSIFLCSVCDIEPCLLFVLIPPSPYFFLAMALNRNIMHFTFRRWYLTTSRLFPQSFHWLAKTPTITRTGSLLVLLVQRLLLSLKYFTPVFLAEKVFPIEDLVRFWWVL